MNREMLFGVLCTYVTIIQFQINLSKILGDIQLYPEESLVTLESMVRNMNKNTALNLIKNMEKGLILL